MSLDRKGINKNNSTIPLQFLNFQTVPGRHTQITRIPAALKMKFPSIRHGVSSLRAGSPLLHRIAEDWRVDEFHFAPRGFFQDSNASHVSKICHKSDFDGILEQHVNPMQAWGHWERERHLKSPKYPNTRHFVCKDGTPPGCIRWGRHGQCPQWIPFWGRAVP